MTAATPRHLLRTMVGAMVFALALPMTGCGDDTEGTPDGGGGGDGGERCGPHSRTEGCIQKTILDTYPEGGELRVEYINTGRARVARASLYRIADQPNPRFELPTEGQCNRIKMEATMGPNVIWPWAQSEGRSYMDLGSNVTVSTGTVTMTLSKTGTTTKDFLGRTHNTWYRFINTGAMPATPWYNHIKFNSRMTANLGGKEVEIFMPQEFTTPTYQPGQMVQLSKSQDWAVQWTTPQNDFDGEFFFIIVFVQPGGAGFTHICNGDNEGHFVVPKSTIAEIPEMGNVILGTITHEVVDLGDQRRFDLLGMNCYNNPYVVMP
jgi:hypothetical protein